MKKILIVSSAILLLFSCQKNEKIEIKDSNLSSNDSLAVSLISETIPEFTISDYNSIQKSPYTNYGIYDLLDFLTHYGQSIDDITPAFGNYNQDISVGGSYLGQLSLVNDEPIISVDVVNIDTLNYEFSWYLNEEFMTNLSNPKVYDFDSIECDGVLQLQLVITDLNSGAKFSRKEWSYFGFNNIEDCVCDNCPSQFDVFYDFYPEVDPYYYMIECATWDLDCDGIIGSNDLMLFLSEFNSQL